MYVSRDLVHLDSASPPGVSGSQPSTPSVQCATRCVCVRINTHTPIYTPTRVKHREDTDNTLIFPSVKKINPHAKQQVLWNHQSDWWFLLLHQEITRVILCRLILNDIIIHIKFLNDIIMFSKIVWHFHVTNFENYVVSFLIRHNNELSMSFICHRIFEQHCSNNITMCDYIISLNKFNNITHSMIFSL